MNSTVHGEARLEKSPKQSPEQLEAEIEELRDELGPLVSEVDRRRHELLDVKYQVRRHAWHIAVVGAGVIAVTTSLVWLGVRRAHERQSLPSRASRLREGVARMSDHPERVATDRGVITQILAAAAAAVVSAAARKTAERVVQQALNRKPIAGADRGRTDRGWPRAA